MFQIRYFYIILLFSISCTKKNNKWFVWNLKDKLSTEKIILENKSIFNFLNLDEDLSEEILNNFKVIDIDSDGDDDIIFHGWSGAESRLTKIYINSNGKYIDKYERFGSIKSIDMITSNKYDFLINLPGCCGDYNFREYLIEMTFKNDNIKYIIKELKINHIESPKPKSLFTKKIKFEVKNNNYFLRVTPEIDSINYFFPGDGPPTNVYHSYKKNDTGIALGQKTDSTGRVWWYVLMDETKYLKDYDNDNILPQYYGWMSSRFLKKIKVSNTM